MSVNKKNDRQLKQRWETALADGLWQKLIMEGAHALGYPLVPDKIDMLQFHALELMKWNEKFNITAIVDPEAVAIKHYVDSMAIAPYIPDHSRVIDLGSGGGFPGIPLKIMKPSIDLVMVDASRKRVSFLNHVCRMLQSKWDLKGTAALHVRGEDLGKEEAYSATFDVVVSRAFTDLASFAEMALPFLNKNGFVLAMKGDVGEDELAGIKKIPLRGSKEGAEVKHEHYSYILPLEGHQRSIVKLNVGEVDGSVC